MSGSALVKGALVAGLITFILPGGGPWMSFDSGLASMGRVLTRQPVQAAAAHVVLAFVYGWVIALAVFRLRLGLAFVAVPALAAGLYAVNYVAVRSFAVEGGNEVHAVMSHVVFTLFFTAVYRATAVPTLKEAERKAGPL